jgi:isopentenyl-diphosphate delta-isomerase
MLNLMDRVQFEKRKQQHIEQALQEGNQAKGLAGFERIFLEHDALGDLRFDEISLASTCLGAPSGSPFFIAAMTAGHEAAFAINRALAQACHLKGWGLGTGSLRRIFEGVGAKIADPNVQKEIQFWRSLKSEFPDLKLFANCGLSQLKGYTNEHVCHVLDELQMECLAVHLNMLQEALQPEGTPDFKGGLARLVSLVSELECDVILKETGCGFSFQALQKLNGAFDGQIYPGALDVSGLGGTHWGRIEGARSLPESSYCQAAQVFANWGVSTVQSVLFARNVAMPGVEIWGSGGVRSGLDAAKLLALGCSQVGVAKPALEAVWDGSHLHANRLELFMSQMEFELKIAMFCTSAKKVGDLGSVVRVQ